MMWILAVQVSLALGYDVCTIWLCCITSVRVNKIGWKEIKVHFFKEELMNSGAKGCKLSMTDIEI